MFLYTLSRIYNTLQLGTCRIGGLCFLPEQTNGTECFICDPSLNKNGWTLKVVYGLTVLAILIY